jgi:hypothetical protein
MRAHSNSAIDPSTPATRRRPAGVLVLMPSPSVTNATPRHATRLPFVEQQHEVTQVPPEAVEPPTGDGAHLVPLHVRRELVECRAASFEPLIAWSTYSTRRHPRASA